MVSSTSVAAGASLGPSAKARTRAAPLIVFENITKKFGAFTALDCVDLAIYPNEFFALLGPSGCGKTTLMRLLAGFETPTRGRVILDGQDLAGIPAHQRPINMMFQSYALFPHMSVEKNIAFGLKQDRLPRNEISQRVARILALVQLEPFARRKPHQLSGGQRQRVALARALAKQPKVLLLDEPLAALDKKLREETQFELINIQEELGITFMIVTHDQEEAMTVADRMAVMRAGKLAQVGSPRTLYEAPASRYVAEFVGDINMLEGRVNAATRAGEAVTIAVDGIAIRAVAPAPLEAGASVQFAIRPEKIAIVKSASAANANQTDGNTLSGTVEEIAYRGGASLFQVRIETGQRLQIIQTNRARATRDTITWDDPVTLQWPAQAGIVLTQ